MKISIVILFICTFNLVAGNVHSQNEKLSLKVTNTTIEGAIAKIEKDNGYVFIYNEDVIPELKKETSLQSKSESISDVLDKLFNETNLAYSITGKQIVVYKKNETKKESTTISPAAQPEQQIGKTVTGKVVDANGEPVIGVTIVVKGDATKGTVTDIDGNYTLSNLPENTVLQITYVGMKPQEINTAQKTRIDVKMEIDTELLDEVVVVGYSVQRKENLTGAVASIKGNVLENRPTATASNLLQGLSAGLSVSASGQGGYPGSTSTVQIRNNASWKGGGALYVIDGFIRNKEAFDMLNPNDISDISVLKDAASSSIYGMYSGNGVILVTTKKGSSGKVQISYNVNYTMNTPTRLPELMNAYDDATLVNTVLSQQGYKPTDPSYFAPDELDHFKNNSYNVFENAWKNPWTLSHNLSINGGNKNMNYYVSGNFLKQGGGLRQEYEKYNVLSKLEGEITTGLSFMLNLDLSYSNNHRPNFPYGTDQNMGYYWYYLYYNLPWYPDFIDGKPVGGGDASNGAAFVSPDYMDTNYRKDQKNYLNGAFELKYKIPGVDGLAAKVRASYNKKYYFYKYFNAAMDVYFFKKGGTNNHIYTSELDYSRPGGYIEKQNIIAGAYGAPEYLSAGFSQNYGYQLDFMLTYDKSFGNHNLNAFAGFEPSETSGDNLSGWGKYYSNLNYQELNGASTDNQNRYANGTSSGYGQSSYFGRIDYNYAQKYLFGFTFRADGSLKFAPGHRWGYFPAVSAGWNISKEDFFKNFTPVIEMLKLRASYGLTGTDNIDYWLWQQKYNYNSSSGMLLGNTTPPSISLGSFANPNVTWEKNRNTDIGLDISMPNRLVTLTADWWYKKTTDILDNRIASTPVTIGATLPAVNYGEASSKGFEITVGHQSKIGEVNYFVDANWSIMSSKILLVDQAATTRDFQNKIGKPIDGWVWGYESEGIIRTQADADKIIAEKGPNFTIFGNKPEPGMIMYKDIRGPLGVDTPDGKVDSNDTQPLSYNGAPRITYGFSAGASWKGLSLSAIFSGYAKYNIMLPSGYTGVRAVGVWQNNLTMWKDSWNKDNTDAPLPAPGFSNKGVFQPSSFWMRNGAFLRLKNVTLSYSLPQNLTNKTILQGVKVYFSGENLLLFDKIKTYDPELGSILAYPLMKSFTFGLNITL